jgi:hypothetical protein
MSCVSGFDSSDWPEQIPAQENFITAYRVDQENGARQARHEYLNWVIDFYEGSLFYPTGWLEIEDRVVAGFAAEEKPLVRLEVQQLGAVIAAEWAKHNEVRMIDTRILALWGSVLQMTANSEQHSAGIELIGLDANGLISGRLTKSLVTEARYADLLGIEFFGGF